MVSQAEDRGIKSRLAPFRHAREIKFEICYDLYGELVDQITNSILRSVTQITMLVERLVS